MTIFSTISQYIEDLQQEWFELQWKFSDERRELAHNRLKAHELALKEGYDSPYIDPDNYKTDWTPIHIKRKPNTETKND